MQHIRWWRALALMLALVGGLGLWTSQANAAPATPAHTVARHNAQNPTRQHTVQRGEWVYQIARQYGVSPQAIIRLNNLRPPYYTVYPGQILLIPGGGTTPPPPAPTAGPGTTYTVRPGDTLFGIAARFGTTAQAIAAANGIANPNLIYPGDVLTIPGGTNPSPPPPPSGTPQPGPVGGMQWGVQAHMLNEDMEAIVEATDAMNLQWLKQQIRWSDFEPAPGNIQWGPIDELVAEAGNKKLLFSVLAAPGWARPAGADANVVGPPADPATYATFVGELARRYCGKVQAIEVWNEQNLAREWGGQAPNAARYMDLLKAAYPAIKQGCPSTVVISGALTPTGAPPPLAVDDFDYLRQMYQNGLRNYADAIGAHPSGFNIPPTLTHTQACAFLQQENARFRGPCDTPHHSWSFRSTMEGTRNIMVQQGDANKKIWVTEFGWAVGSGTVPTGYEYALDNTRGEQAAWTAQAFSIARDSGYVGGMVLWNLNFAIVQPGSEQALWSVYAPGYDPTITVPAVRDTPH